MYSDDWDNKERLLCKCTEKWINKGYCVHLYVAVRKIMKGYCVHPYNNG